MRIFRSGPRCPRSPSGLNSWVDLRILRVRWIPRGAPRSAIYPGRVIQTARRTSLDSDCLERMKHQRVGCAQLPSNRAGGHAGKVHLLDLQIACATFWIMANIPSVPAADFTSHDFPPHVSSSPTALCLPHSAPARPVPARGQAAGLPPSSDVACRPSSYLEILHLVKLWLPQDQVYHTLIL